MCYPGLWSRLWSLVIVFGLWCWSSLVLALAWVLVLVGLGVFGVFIYSLGLLWSLAFGLNHSLMSWFYPQNQFVFSLPCLVLPFV